MFIPRTIFVSALVDGKLFCTRKLLIRMGEADANVDAMTAKVMAEVGSDEPLVLLNSKGQEIADSEGSRCKFYDRLNLIWASGVPQGSILDLFCLLKGKLPLTIA